jgi:hypothetical protein
MDLTTRRRIHRRHRPIKTGGAITLAASGFFAIPMVFEKQLFIDYSQRLAHWRANLVPAESGRRPVDPG